MNTRSRRLLLGIALAVAAVTSLTSCGGEGQPPTAGDPSKSGETTVAVRGIQYQPTTLEISAGTEVTWTNDDPVDHTVTSGQQQEQGIPGVSKGERARPDGMFDGVLGSKGTTFSFTFDEAGTFSYYCEIHAGMTGTVIVE